MGNSSFGIPTLERLLGSHHKVVLVVTNPNKPQGRGRHVLSTPIANFVTHYRDLPIFQPERLNSDATYTYLKSLQLDLIVVVAYKIIPDSILALPVLGSINLHPSLLPKYRGASPIQRTLMNRDVESGITSFYIQKEVDAGNILMQKRVIVYPSDCFGSLSTRMSKMGADLIRQTIDSISEEITSASPQDRTTTSYAPKISKDEWFIDWKKPAREIHSKINALSPTPSAYTIFKEKKMKILSAELSLQESQFAGLVIHVEKGYFKVRCGTGSIKIKELQLEGKGPMTADEFLKGHRVTIGDVLGYRNTLDK